MPIVTIQVTREGTAPGAGTVTSEEKAALIKGASQLLLDVLGKPLESTFVIVDEVDTDNWGRADFPSASIERSSPGIAQHPRVSGASGISWIAASSPSAMAAI
jgi:4-oxalocrotonate tautomerase